MTEAEATTPQSDDAALIRAISGIATRLPRLEQAAADARGAFETATLNAAGLETQDARRAARKDAEVLLAASIAKKATLDGERAALAAAEHKLRARRAERETAAQEALIEAEKRAAGAAVQGFYDAAVAFTTAADVLGERFRQVNETAAAAWLLLPQRNKDAVFHRITGGARMALARQILIDRGLINGLYSQGGDKTAPKAKMTDVFVVPELRELLPFRDDGERAA